MSLLAQHQRLIRESAISDEVAAERGYWSATRPAELERWFGRTQCRLVPALVLPVYSVRGELELVQIRPDEPRVVKGKSRKYELPSGCRLVLDVPPRVRPALPDPAIPLLITEGARKADAAVSAGLNAIAIPGVTTWRGRNEHGGKTALPDHELIAWNGRILYLCFDSDALVKREVWAALERYRAFLARLEAEVRIIYLPNGEGGAKVGLDDYLAAGHSRDDVLALASDELREPGGQKRSSSSAPVARLRPTYEFAHEVGRVLDRFVVLPSRAAALTIALFVLHSWAFDAAHATPYLVLQSAVKRSGKSRVEEVLELLVRAPWRIAATSEAAMFRKIDAEQPTLLMDEVDALFGSRTEGTEPIRAILNAGNRPGAAVSRVVGEGASMTVADFSVYCPKVLAGINTSRWPDTVLDRAIVVQLRRKKPGEELERLRPRKLRAELEQLRAELARWAAEHLEELRELEPEFVPGLDDRAFEAWEPLLAIAELAELEGGAGWKQNARKAALVLAGERPADADGDPVAALAAIRRLFDAERVEALGSGAIVEALNDNEELPFGGWRKGAGIDARGLARLLRPFGIAPHVVRIAEQTPRGYHREQFVDAWERYPGPLQEAPETRTRTFSPRDRDPDPQQRNNPSNDRRSGAFSDPQQGADVADRETAENPTGHGACCTVADQNGQPGTETRIDVLSAPTAKGRAVLVKLTHEQRLEHWRARREQHQRELETGAPTLAELTAEQLLETFPGAELERTDVDRAAEVIACSLAGSKYVIGQWWPSAPIRRGLRVYGITDETVIDAALQMPQVQVRKQGATGARWRLARVPELPRPAIERTAECRCDQRSREWRLATGGAWTCALCHPPADGLEIEHRTSAEDAELLGLPPGGGAA